MLYLTTHGSIRRCLIVAGVWTFCIVLSTEACCCPRRLYEGKTRAVVKLKSLKVDYGWWRIPNLPSTMPRHDPRRSIYWSGEIKRFYSILFGPFPNYQMASKFKQNLKGLFAWRKDSMGLMPRCCNGTNIYYDPESQKTFWWSQKIQQRIGLRAMAKWLLWRCACKFVVQNRPEYLYECNCPLIINVTCL